MMQTIRTTGLSRFGGPTVFIAFIGYGFGIVAVYFARDVFTDETQTNAVIWLRMTAIALGIASAGFVIATGQSVKEQGRVMEMLIAQRSAQNRDSIELVQLRSALRAGLDGLDVSEGGDEDRTEAEEIRELQLSLERLTRALDDQREENDALRSILGQGRGTANE